MSIEEQLVSFIASTLSKGNAALVDDFVVNGPIPGGSDAAYRYLLAVALRNITAHEFAGITGVSEDVAQRLLAWLDAGTRS